MLYFSDPASTLAPLPSSIETTTTSKGVKGKGKAPVKKGKPSSRAGNANSKKPAAKGKAKKKYDSSDEDDDVF